MTNTLVGHIKKIYRYPVKGMRGKELERADLSWHGLQGDRRYALAARNDRSGFPWLTGRLKAELISYVPAFENADEPNTSDIKVNTPLGVAHALKSELFLEELASLFDIPLELIKLDRGCFDSATLSIISHNTLDTISNAVGETLNPRRFRPNLFVALLDEDPSPEDAWLGKRLQIGEASDAPIIQIDRQNVRCVITNIEPDSIAKNPAVFKYITQERDQRAGVYASPVRLGEIVNGAPLYLID